MTSTSVVLNQQMYKERGLKIQTFKWFFTLQLKYDTLHSFNSVAYCNPAVDSNDCAAAAWW